MGTPGRSGHSAQPALNNRNKALNITTTTLIPFLFVACFICTATAKQPSFQTITSGRQTVDGDGYRGKGFTVLPLLSDDERATAIVIHGLGGTGEEWGFISLALSFFSLNYVKFIIPAARTEPVSYLGENMPSWFDIFGITSNSADINRGQLLTSVDRIHEIIQGEVENGVKEDRIFVIGFSQGGALALTSFLRSPWTLGGCVGVATWLPLATEYPQQRSSSIEKKDILLIHGSEDEAVRLKFAKDSRDALRAIGQKVNLSVLQGEPHIVMNTVVLDSIESYITTRASGTTRYLKTLVKDLTDTFAGLTSSLDGVPRF